MIDPSRAQPRAHCPTCSYLLVGNPAPERCSECGCATDAGAHLNRLERASPAWIRRVRIGLTALTLTIPLSVALCVVNALRPLPGTALLTAVGAVALLWLFGVWRFSSPDPAVGIASPRWALPTMRIAALATATAVIFYFSPVRRSVPIGWILLGGFVAGPYGLSLVLTLLGCAWTASELNGRAGKLIVGRAIRHAAYVAAAGWSAGLLALLSSPFAWAGIIDFFAALAITAALGTLYLLTWVAAFESVPAIRRLRRAEMRSYAARIASASTRRRQEAERARARRTEGPLL